MHFLLNSKIRSDQKKIKKIRLLFFKTQKSNPIAVFAKNTDPIHFYRKKSPKAKNAKKVPIRCKKRGFPKTD